MADRKYPTSLTGEQIDRALADMASRNSEAYAVGKRNEQEVEASDPAYHNNSKYYSEQARVSAAGAAGSASSASASASSASASAASASASAANAGDSASAAGQQAQRAENAAERAEAIVGGHYVSYGEPQGLSEAQKMQARKNIGVNFGLSVIDGKIAMTITT